MFPRLSQEDIGQLLHVKPSGVRDFTLNEDFVADLGSDVIDSPEWWSNVVGNLIASP